jgi:hypothetical protein
VAEHGVCRSASGVLISVRRAFNRYTTTPVLFAAALGGSWDANNQWVVGSMGEVTAINATPIPHGDRDEGVFGAQLKANPELERVPAFMKFHSTVDMPMKSLLCVYGTTYMVTQHGDVSAAGYYMVIASKVQNLVLQLGVPAPLDAVPDAPETPPGEVAGWP